MFLTMRITGIILTGGKSRRMGTDKALLKIDGKLLLDKAVELCCSVCDEVLISSDSAQHERAGIRRIKDEYKDCGPMSGIYSCMKHSSNEWNFVMSVDAPFVEVDFIEFMLKNTDKFEAVVPVHDGKKEPLIALYHQGTKPVFRSLLDEGNYKMHFLLEKVSANFLMVEEWLVRFPKIFNNLNTLEDLNRTNQ